MLNLEAKRATQHILLHFGGCTTPIGDSLVAISNYDSDVRYKNVTGDEIWCRKMCEKEMCANKVHRYAHKHGIREVHGQNDKD